MGKKQHQKDKLYLTTTEWRESYGGHKGRQDPEKSEFRRLPFTHCGLSLQPFENALCTPEGHCYDLMNIVPFVKKFKINPITGKPLEVKSLIKLKFHKNADGKYHCPVLFKVFTGNSHIVAVKKTGNVFSYEAVEQLNIKPQNWHDLINDEPFLRKDLITIQDPKDLTKFNLSSFHHIKNNVKIIDKKAELAKSERLNVVSAETKDILNELDTVFKPASKEEEKETPTADKFNAASYSTGKVAAGFTSTTMEPVLEQKAAIIEEDIVRYERVKKKGYVRLITTHGQLNIELHCDMIPKTCENFMKLCQNGYYNGTVFHRSIRNFMVQGGDPEGSGNGGDSYWGGTFKDEFKPNLSHTGRGIVSMANSGPDTNKSQFFVTYRSCKHLDGKHTVFGRVVGGLETLNAIEKVETDNKDRPIEPIMVQRCVIFVDPYVEADEQLAKEREEERLKEEAEMNSVKTKVERKQQPLKVYKSGIGKYIAPSGSTKRTQEGPEQQAVKKKPKINYGFGDFSTW